MAGANALGEKGEQRMTWKETWQWVEGNFERVLAVLALGTMVVLLTTIVFFRFALDRGFSSAEELERMVFVWFVYLSAIYAAQQGKHIRMEAQLQLLSPRARKIVRLLADGIWIGFNWIMIREGIYLVRSLFEYPYESPALGWSMAYVYMIVPISFTLISIRILQHIYRDLKGLIRGEGSRP